MAGEVMVCGVDCFPGNQRCNGYCQGRKDSPPEATLELILHRKRQKAHEELRKAAEAWFEYAAACDLSSERDRAFVVYERIKWAPNI